MLPKRNLKNIKTNIWSFIRDAYWNRRNKLCFRLFTFFKNAAEV